MLIATDAGLTLRNGTLCTVDHEATVRLHALIAAAGTNDAERRTGGEMTIARSNHLLPLSITVSPAQRQRSELSFSRSSVLVCVSDPDAGIDVADRRLREVLGLSRAETRLAVLLLEGKNLKEAARALGVSYHTVRGHLVRMFAKTGASRQSDLIRLMMRVAGQT